MDIQYINYKSVVLSINEVPWQISVTLTQSLEVASSPPVESCKCMGKKVNIICFILSSSFATKKETKNK